MDNRRILPEYEGDYNKIKRLLNIFKNMKNRCYNTKAVGYKYYGEKGIKICDDWLCNKVNFIYWALDNGYENGLTIDRIDSNKDYTPDNCRWIDGRENSRRASGKYIKIDNQEYTIRQWANIIGIDHKSIIGYGKRHGDEEIKKYIKDKLEDPTSHRKEILIEVDGESHSLRYWGKITGWNRDSISKYNKKYGKEKTAQKIKEILTNL